MKTRDEVVQKIEATKNNWMHILNQKPADVMINAPVALMQMQIIERLDMLFWAIDEERPKYKYDEQER